MNPFGVLKSVNQLRPVDLMELSRFPSYARTLSRPTPKPIGQKRAWKKRRAAGNRTKH